MTEIHQIYRRLHMLLRYLLGISTNIQVQEPASEQCSASSSVRDERNMGMPPCFEELMQESYASNGEPSAHGCSFSDLSNEDVSLPDAHALLHVTSRRKPNTMVCDSHFQLMQHIAIEA